MQASTINSIVTGLKTAGIDFIATLPCTVTAPLLPAIAAEPGFKHVPVANEGDGVVICAGAWLGGKRPALLIENTGILTGTYALTGLDGMYGGMPLVLLVDHRGSFGDGGGYWYFGAGEMAPVVLDGLGIAYTEIADPSRMEHEIARAQRTAEAARKPTAILMTATDTW